MNRLAKVSLIIIAVLIALTIRGVVYADGPVPKEATLVENPEDENRPPPLPPIPTADQYIPPPDPSDRIQTPTDNTDGEDTAADETPC